MPVVARNRPLKLRLLVLAILAIMVLFAGMVVLRSLFPLEYQEEIQEWSRVYDLEPAWVASIIRFESRFRRDAVSPAGAIGLMQIMPSTGTWIAEKHEWIDPSNLSLEDAATSIALGTWYLRYLLDRFGTSDAALMAYNAGPSNAVRWNGNLEQAFPETQRYLRRIQLCLPIYRVYFRALWLVDLIPSGQFSY
jgi:soluble lytic murein transglycosylase